MKNPYLVLFALFAFSTLAACVSDEAAKGNGASVETSTSKSLSPETRARYLRLWNQPGISSKSVTWPSDGAGQYTSSSLFLTGLNAKLPASIASSFSSDPIVRKVVAGVYQKTILKGMDTDLGKKYLNTSFGRRELRSTYLFELAKKCHGVVPKEQKRAFLAFYETGKNAPGRYKCEKDSQYSEKAMR